MRIGICSEPTGTLGGTEVSVAVLADALSRRHDVEIVHHRKTLTVAELAKFSGTNLGGVKLRFVAPPGPAPHESRMPWKRLADARRRQEELSSPYDAFIMVGHGVPPFCHAKRGVLICMFPTVIPIHRAGRTGFSPRAWAASWYSRLEWRKRMATYSSVVGNSTFTSRWIEARWGVKAGVVYPPCTMTAVNIPKEPLILSVGRFSTKGHTKSQLDMAGAFGTMGVNDWSLTFAGSVGDDPEEAAYLKAVQAACTGSSGVLTNLSRDEISELYGRASIYWHGAGFCNTERVPDHYEHFGMTTVEAMSAGCVPLVFDGGGQPEIVEHGVSGFVWRTLDELGDFTRRLTSDPALLNQMSRAARIRSRRYSHEAWVSGVTNLVEATAAQGQTLAAEARA